MNANLHTTKGITALHAWPDGSTADRWCIRFRSSHEGWHHQLYANGVLAGWTEATQERSFLLDGADGPLEIAVAACPPEQRHLDAAARLGLAELGGGWTARLRLLRSAVHRPHDRAQIVNAGGDLLLDEPLWPAWQAPWTFGHDAWGLGGFGFDGALGPGLGCGAFGAGEMGFDGFLLDAALPLEGDGLHELTVCTRGPDGETAQLPPLVRAVHAPPAPAANLRLLDADDAGRLTFAIETRDHTNA